MDISVVMLTYNAGNGLAECLDVIFKQETRFSFEVICIDSGSTDSSLEILRQFPCKVYQISPESFNHGETRNFGISKSTAEYIVFVTQDALPFDRFWMNRLVDTLKADKRVAGAYSRQVPFSNSSPLAKMRANKLLTFRETGVTSVINNIEDYKNLSPKEKRIFCNFDNVSSCIRRSAWLEIPFPRSDFGEDIEWSERVLRAGFKIVYEPGSIVYHAHEFSLSQWYKRNRADAKMLSALFGADTIGSSGFDLIKLILKDMAGLLKVSKNFLAIALSICQVPFFVFFGVLGRQHGFKESLRKL